MSIAAGFAFGASAIVGSRLFGENDSILLTVLIVLGLFVIFAATENRRYQIASAEKSVMDQLVYLEDADN
jgi:drug/metabolite transporter (DMT)-like permease